MASSVKLEGPGSRERLVRLRRGFRSPRVGRRIRGRDVGLVSAGVLVGAVAVAALDFVAPRSHGFTQQFAYYSNCREALLDGVTSIQRGQPGYRPELDADNDGIACEPWRRR